MHDLIASRIRDVPDFPKKGIVFKDITPLLADPVAFRAAIDAFAERYRPRPPKHIVAIESRGFLFGAALSYALGTSLLVVRKPGKLPWKCIRQDYALEYGSDSLEMHVDMLQPGDGVLIIDDLLATGGTAEAVGRLVEGQGAKIVDFAFVVELEALKGRERLGADRVFSLVSYR
jgi:adenine phosphoribosyltransferase